MPTEDQKSGQIYVTSQSISRTKSTRKESSSAALSKSRKMDEKIKLNSKENNNLIRSNTSKSGKQQKTQTDLKYATVKENSRKVLHPQPMDVKATSRNNQVNTLPNPRKSQKKEICDIDDPERRKSLKAKKSNLDKPISKDGNKINLLVQEKIIFNLVPFLSSMKFCRILSHYSFGEGT